MQDYQRTFIELALAHQALRFGKFTLKSGRVSPYFFNAGLLCADGTALAQLGACYAAAIRHANLHYHMLFGPAYKGIPLAAATAMALARDGGSVPFCFNRKEAKTHGEAGELVGAPLQGNVLIVDDVMTAGTAVRESVALIQSHGAQPGGVVVALDRQERGSSALSAVQETGQQYRIPVVSIITLADIIHHVAEDPALQGYLTAIEAYRSEFGV